MSEYDGVDRNYDARDVVDGENTEPDDPKVKVTAVQLVIIYYHLVLVLFISLQYLDLFIYLFIWIRND